MPLDGISTRCLTAELNLALTDARVDRIHQPDRHDILFVLRRRHENLRLIVSANPSSPRLHLTTESRENPAMPPMFCMLLRKHLLGARILSVTTPGSERIVEIRFLTQNELGDKVEKSLVAELMGRHSNIIFLNQDRRIHDAIVHVDAAVSRVREVMPARPYVAPPDQGKRTIEDAAPMLDALDLDNRPDSPETAPLLAFFPDALQLKGIEKALLELMAGFSPALCHEIAFQAGLDGRQSLNRLRADQLRLLLLALRQVVRSTLNGAFRPTAFFRAVDETVPVDFHAFALSDFAVRRLMPSLSDAMDLYYLERSRQNALNQRKAALSRLISRQLDQARRRLIIHQTDLEESRKKDDYKRNGDLILAYLHTIREGQTTLSLSGEETGDGEPLSVELDPSLSPSQNAQYAYKLYAKARNRAVMSERFVQEDQSEIEWLESLESALAAAEEPADLSAIREELAADGPSARMTGSNESSVTDDNGLACGSGTRSGPQKGFEPGRPSGRKKSRAKTTTGKRTAKGAKAPAPLPPRRYVSSDGFSILVGRNNLQNDQLTLKQAHKEDTWLHVQRMPGTHVIIQNGKKPVPQRTLLEAAETAAYFSRASVAGEGAKVAVDYCPAGHVKKPSGARPGKVIYDRYQTLIVQPRDPKRLLPKPHSPDPA